MSKTTLFVIRDTNAQMVTATIFQKREGPAIRSFHEILSQPDTMPGRYPKDYELLKVGEMDDETGKVTGFDHVEKIEDGAHWLEEREQAMKFVNRQQQESNASH